MKSGTIRGGAVVLLSLAMGCGSKQTPVDSPPAAGSAGAPVAAGTGRRPPGTRRRRLPGRPRRPRRRDGGPKPGGRGFRPKERPFANTPLEAQSLIQEQIDAHMTPLLEVRERLPPKKGDPHKPVVVDVGIDQEGNLLGVTSPNIKKGDLDPVMRDCMTDGPSWASVPQESRGDHHRATDVQRRRRAAMKTLPVALGDHGSAGVRAGGGGVRLAIRAAPSARARAPRCTSTSPPTERRPPSACALRRGCATATAQCTRARRLGMRAVRSSRERASARATWTSSAAAACPPTSTSSSASRR